MDLNALHAQIATQRRELELDRGSPALLIEHACTDKEQQEMVACVAEALAAHDLDEPFWRTRYLPLLVIATEVGYAFGEERHEYWPRLSQHLNTSFGEDWRCSALTKLYPREVQPPPTEWARHFNRIALPVTHALLPKWLHEPLLELLLTCPLQVVRDGPYFDWMSAAASKHPKLAILMHPDRERLAREVIEGILEVSEPQLIRPETLARFRRDVYATPSTRAKLRAARARQPTLAPAPAPAQTTRAARHDATPVVVPMTLSFEPLGLALRPITLSGPTPDKADYIRLYPLSERRPTSLSALLHDGAPLGRPLPEAVGELTPIFDDRVSELPSSLRLQLLALRAHVRPPLLFSDRRGAGGVAGQVLNSSFGPTPGWWVLIAGPPPYVDGLFTNGEVGGLTCVQVDASHEAAATWLTSLGFNRMTTPSLRLVGAAPLDGPAGRLFDPKDAVAIEVDSGPVLCDRAPLTDGLYLLPEAGERAFENPAGASALLLKLARAALPQRLPDVQVELVGDALSADALRARRLGLRIYGRAALAGLRAQVTAELDDNIIATATTARLPTLPCRIDHDDPVWTALAAGIPVGRPVALRVEVGGIGRARWWLQPEAGEVSWRGAVAVGEREIVGYEYVNADAPLEATTTPGPIHLKIPRYAEGAAGPGSALCVAPKRLVLGELTPMQPARVTRDWAGVHPILSALQRWSTARTENFLAEAARYAVVRELDGWAERALCGSCWSTARSRLPGRSSVGAVLAAHLRRDKVAFDDRAEKGWDTARGVSFVRAVAVALDGAEAWLRRVAEGEVDPGELAPLLDVAYRAVGVAEEPDLPCEEEATRASLQRGFAEWDARAELSPMVHRLLPQSKRESLAALPFVEAGDDELIEALTRWLRAASLVAPWPRDEVRALLGLWLWPGRIELTESAFERALADQMGARAVRYAALRRRSTVP